MATSEEILSWGKKPITVFGKDGSRAPVFKGLSVQSDIGSPMEIQIIEMLNKLDLPITESKINDELNKIQINRKKVGNNFAYRPGEATYKKFEVPLTNKDFAGNGQTRGKFYVNYSTEFEPSLEEKQRLAAIRLALNAVQGMPKIESPEEKQVFMEMYKARVQAAQQSVMRKNVQVNPEISHMTQLNLLHQQRLNNLKARYGENQPSWLKDAAPRPFVSKNGAVVFAITAKQLAILEQIDDQLARGDRTTLNAALGVGEGKSYMASLLRSIYGDGENKAVIKPGAAERVEKVDGIDMKIPAVPVEADIPPLVFVNLSLPDVYKGMTEQQIRDDINGRLEVLKDGDTALITFDEFYQLPPRTQGIILGCLRDIQTNLPSLQIQQFVVSATPNLVVLEGELQELRYKKESATSIEEKDTLQKKIEAKQADIETLNRRRKSFEDAVLGNDGRPKADISLAPLDINETPEDPSGIMKLKNTILEDFSNTSITGDAQLLLPDVDPENLNAMFNVKGDFVRQLKSKGVNAVLYMDEKGNEHYINLTGTTITDIARPEKSPGKVLMVYSSANSVGGDFGDYSRNLKHQFVYSRNQLDSAQLLQFFARNRVDVGDAGVPTPECKRVIRVPSPAPSIERFLQLSRDRNQVRELALALDIYDDKILKFLKDNGISKKENQSNDDFIDANSGFLEQNAIDLYSVRQGIIGELNKYKEIGFYKVAKLQIEVEELRLRRKQLIMEHQYIQAAAKFNEKGQVQASDDQGERNRTLENIKKEIRDIEVEIESKKVARNEMAELENRKVERQINIADLDRDEDLDFGNYNGAGSERKEGDHDSVPRIKPTDKRSDPSAGRATKPKVRPGTPDSGVIDGSAGLAEILERLKALEQKDAKRLRTVEGRVTSLEKRVTDLERFQDKATADIEKLSTEISSIDLKSKNAQVVIKQYFDDFFEKRMGDVYNEFKEGDDKVRQDLLEQMANLRIEIGKLSSNPAGITEDNLNTALKTFREQQNKALEAAKQELQSQMSSMDKKFTERMDSIQAEFGKLSERVTAHNTAIANLTKDVRDLRKSFDSFQRTTNQSLNELNVQINKYEPGSQEFNDAVNRYFSTYKIAISDIDGLDPTVAAQLQQSIEDLRLRIDEFATKGDLENIQKAMQESLEAQKAAIESLISSSISQVNANIEKEVEARKALEEEMQSSIGKQTIAIEELQSKVEMFEAFQKTTSAKLSELETAIQDMDPKSGAFKSTIESYIQLQIDAIEKGVTPQDETLAKQLEEQVKILQARIEELEKRPGGITTEEVNRLIVDFRSKQETTLKSETTKIMETVERQNETIADLQKQLAEEAKLREEGDKALGGRIDTLSNELSIKIRESVTRIEGLENNYSALLSKFETRIGDTDIIDIAKTATESIETLRNLMEKVRINEESRKEAEGLRADAEIARGEYESARVEAEAKRQEEFSRMVLELQAKLEEVNELNIRLTAESEVATVDKKELVEKISKTLSEIKGLQERISAAELMRARGENERRVHEERRMANERLREANEKERMANERQRIANEHQRQLNEMVRIANEEIRIENEHERMQAAQQIMIDGEGYLIIGGLRIINIHTGEKLHDVRDLPTTPSTPPAPPTTRDTPSSHRPTMKAEGVGDVDPSNPLGRLGDASIATLEKPNAVHKILISKPSTVATVYDANNKMVRDGEAAIEAKRFQEYVRDTVNDIEHVPGRNDFARLETIQRLGTTIEKTGEQGGMLCGEVRLGEDGRPYVSLMLIGEKVDGYFTLEGKDKKGNNYTIRIDAGTLQSDIRRGDGEFEPLPENHGLFVLEPVLSLSHDLTRPVPRDYKTMSYEEFKAQEQANKVALETSKTKGAEMQ